MRQIFGNFIAGRAAIGLLILRVVAGGALMLHGWPKIINPQTGAFSAFSWMDRPGQPASPVPDIIQALAALSEFGGGLALILGLLTPLAALGIACVMIGALMMVHVPAGDPWVSPPGRRGGSLEPALGYLAVALMFLFTGPGVLSLDALLFGRNRRVH